MTRIKQINQWEATVIEIVMQYKRLDSACSAAEKAGTMNPEGQLHEAIWVAFGKMLGKIDVDGWISWYIYENDCGKKGREAKGCGRLGLRAIKTARQLAMLIVESDESSSQNA